MKQREDGRAAQPDAEREQRGDLDATSGIKRVLVVPYDAQWSHLFAQERNRLAEILGAAALAIHHIGSTSVPNLCAKPVIDILTETADIAMIDAMTPRIEACGYTAKGEYGIPGRRYFSRSGGPGPNVHLHVFRADDPHIGRHLRFRDYLRNRPAAAAKYGALKQVLATAHSNDGGAYQAGKSAFIEQIEAEAAAWEARE